MLKYSSLLVVDLVEKIMLVVVEQVVLGQSLVFL